MVALHVELRVEGRVHMGYVVAPVEVVVTDDLPVALQGPDLLTGEPQRVPVGVTEGCLEFGGMLREGDGVLAKVDEDPHAPSCDRDGGQ